MPDVLYPATIALLEVVRKSDTGPYLDEQSLQRFGDTFEATLNAKTPIETLFPIVAQVLNGLGYLVTQVDDQEVLRPLFEEAGRVLIPHQTRIQQYAVSLTAPETGEKMEPSRDFSRLMPEAKPGEARSRASRWISSRSRT